jgi:hypothetical protein
MFTTPGPIPKGAVFFAYQIADRFGLCREASVDFIQKAIVAALREQEDAHHSRELLACAQCGILLSRYACILDRFGTCCPQCRTPMAAPDILYMKRITELEDKIRRLEGKDDAASAPTTRFPRPRAFNRSTTAS